MTAKILRLLLFLIAIGQILAILLHATFFGYGWNEFLLDLVDRGTIGILALALWYLFGRIEE